MGLPLYFSGRFGGIDAEMCRTNSGLQNVFYQDSPATDYKVLQSKEGNSTRLKFPAVAADLRTRWCSACVKIDVMRRIIPVLYPTGEHVVCTGERRQESANRAKYHRTEPHPCSTQSRSVTAWRPMLEWSEQQVWKIIQRWGIQPHPCYELGYSRCSCQICIFGSDDVWATNAELSPQKIDYIERREQQFGFTLYNGQTIREKVAKGTSFLTPQNKEKWAAQALGQFTAPIYNSNWKTPQGAYSTHRAGSV